jgi:hypothetical protein
METNHRTIVIKKTGLSRKSIIKIFVAVPLVVSFIMNVTWLATRIGWLYWGSRFLFSLVQVMVGIFLLLFPKALLQIWLGSKIDQRIMALLMAALVILLGSGLLIFGVIDLSMLARRWIIDCSNAVDCLK